MFKLSSVFDSLSVVPPVVESLPVVAAVIASYSTTSAPVFFTISAALTELNVLPNTDIIAKAIAVFLTNFPLLIILLFLSLAKFLIKFYHY